MKRDGHNSATYFIGSEVEHTPAFSRKTLFVVGRQDVAEIEKHAKEHNVTHVFMGANHSFDALHDPKQFGKTWNDQITYFLDQGYMVTLDYQAHQHEIVLKMLAPTVWQSRNFVPLLSVRVPNVETSSPNLTIKIDDIDFNATNPGVWCMHFHEVTDSNRFTDWIQYGTDVVIAEHTNTQAVAPVAEKVVHHTDAGNSLPAEAVEKVIIDTDNNAGIGIDITAKSALKAETTKGLVPPAVAILTPEIAANAYAEGATKDPLSAKESTKAVVAKAKK